MGFFSAPSAIGLSWSATGRCSGVLLCRHGERVTVERFWQVDAGSDEQIPPALAMGRSSLGADENVILVAGNSDLRAGLVDLNMPVLPSADLRNALQFELARLSPIPVEKLVWGYRILGGDESGQQRVRVMYLRESEWGKWVEDLGGLANGVDLIIPPVAVLDPLLAGQPVYFSIPNSEGGYISGLSETGLREVAFAEAPAEDDSDLLAGYGVDLGELGQLPVEEQRAFMPAVLLALYGLGTNLPHDRTTWLPVPYDLQPRRHRYSRLVAACLAFATVLFVLIGVAREMAAAADYHKALRQESANLKELMAEMESAKASAEAVSTLRTELKEARIDRPSMTECLLEVTRLTDDDVWVRFFNWNDGKIEVEFSTENHDVDLLAKLESSPILLDVVPQSRRVDPKNVLTLRMQMYAGYKGESKGERKVEPLGGNNPSATEESAEEVAEEATEEAKATEEGN